MTARKRVAVGVAAAAFVLASCPDPKTGTVTDPDAGEFVPECLQDSDCPVGKICGEGRCGVVQQVEDAGAGCTIDRDCPEGHVCLKSTGECLLVKYEDAGTPDAGVNVADLTASDFQFV
jgi:hypothetical protein